MKNLTRIICLTLAVLLGSTGTSWGADYYKGFDAYQSGDYATALRELQPLAEQGDVNAQVFLGMMYDKGLGVLQDYKTAVKWWTLAAEQGFADAQNNLGVMYAVGEGVIQNFVYAHMWGNIAASNGHETGDELRDIVAEEMTASQIEEAEKLARECIRKKYKGC